MDPHGRSILGGFAAAVRKDRLEYGREPFDPSLYRRWRYVYSPRLMEADAFGRSLAWLREGSLSDRESYSKENRIREAIFKDAARTGNVVLAFSPVHQPPYVRARELRAQVRLLRVAAHFRAKEAVLELEDPFGGTLLHSREVDRLRVWSRGRDGEDHGGAGAWKPPSRKDGKDIVLEVER